MSLCNFRNAVQSRGSEQQEKQPLNFKLVLHQLFLFKILAALNWDTDTVSNVDPGTGGALQLVRCSEGEMNVNYPAAPFASAAN